MLFEHLIVLRTADEQDLTEVFLRIASLRRNYGVSHLKRGIVFYRLLLCLCFVFGKMSQSTLSKFCCLVSQVRLFDNL